jgi:hypothetical protein
MRRLEMMLCVLVNDGASVDEFRAAYERLSATLKHKAVGLDVLQAAVKADRVDIINEIIHVGVEKVTSTFMCNAYMCNASVDVLNALDVVFNRTKHSFLMDLLVEQNNRSELALYHFKRAHARYDVPPNMQCWKWVIFKTKTNYDAWHEELKGKVPPINHPAIAQRSPPSTTSRVGGAAARS